MRLHRLLIPLTLALALGAASPAMAADVDVTDFAFTPKDAKIAPGDSVVWTFTNGGHTTTAAKGQPDSWDSTKGDGGFNVAGETFEHTFTKPGRYQYICVPHASFMKGTVTVGQDTVAKTVQGLRTKPRGRSVTVSFKLNEAARMTYALKGPGKFRRTLKRARLEPGKHSFKVKRLKPGRYRGTLTLTDDFDKKAKPKTSFVIR
jgi:plastocyanin